jgi:putative ATP-binding cassette transporter
MNLIWLLLRASWFTVAIAVFTGLLSGGCSALLIALINHAVSSNGSSTTTLVWSFAGLALVIQITGFVSQFLLIRLSQGAIYKLRMRLSSWILSCPLRHLEELGANRLLAALTEDVQSVSNSIFEIPLLCIDIAIVMGCLIYLGWLSWAVFLLTLGFMVVAAFSVQMLLTKARVFLTLAREEQDRLFQHFRAITEGTKELKLHRQRRQAFLYEELHSTAASSRHYNVVSLIIFAITNGWGQIFFFVIIGLLLFGLPHLVTINNSILSGYVLTMIYLMRPVASIMEMLPGVNRASVALNKVEALGLSLASRSEEESNVQYDPKPDWNRLELINITHAYRKEREESSFTFGPITLTFYAGELVFIVGGNGSGKSTLAKLITGLYIPETGEIRFDGKLITDENREWYRQHFSVVFSDFYLFERLLGINSTDLELQVKDYLVQLQLDHKVQIRDGILSTTALSQGQRKRLALLTAYLENRSIYLFDEWASDQDPLFKEIFYKQLLPDLKRRGKTVLIISHDERYFHLADRIVKLDYGKLLYDKRFNS